jgi:hypothetical protein
MAQKRTIKTAEKVTKRDADRALRDALTPLLRARGFQGTLPHFHAVHADGEVWIVSVQHDKYGGGFRAELAWVPPRSLFPKLASPRPRSPSTLKAWSMTPEFRKIVPRVSARATGFVRYEVDLVRATKRVVAAVDHVVPTWFEANRGVASRIGSKTSVSTLRRLREEAPWVGLWIEANQKSAAPRTAREGK